MFALISCLEILILLKVSQIQNLNNCVWQQRKPSFMFNDLLYKQIHGVTMGASLGRSRLNAFLSYHEKSGQTIIPNDLSKFFNDVMWMVFLHFRNSHLKYFQDFLNSRHINMSFFLETEKKNELSFLDFEYTCKQGKFTATFYRKSTFSGTYSNFESFSLLAWSIWFILFIIFSL